jgi:hypothetical protein
MRPAGNRQGDISYAWAVVLKGTLTMPIWYIGSADHPERR